MIDLKPQKRKEKINMSNYVLSCCSTADMSKEFFDRRDIKYACFHYTLNGKHYPDDLGQTMSFEEFYKEMENGAEASTSQVNVGEFYDYFSHFLEEGRDIVHLSFSSGLSGSYNSACVARDELKEKFPERKIYVVDTICASSGFGLLVDKAADLRDSGYTAEELVEWVEANRLKVHHWFYATDLTQFVKGGRISKASGWFGTLLKICPLLNMSYEGKLVPREKVRTKSAVMKRIVDKMAEHADGGTEYSGKCFMCNSMCPEDARAVADMVEARFPNLDGKVVINTIGTTIGCHTGVGTVALFFFGDERND